MGFTVRLAGSDTSFHVQGHESILDAAIRAGIPLEYGCSTGNCGRCRARLLGGEVRPLRHQDYVFSATEKARNEILLCTSTAATDLLLEAVIAGSAGEIPTQRMRVRVRRIDRVSPDLMVLQFQVPRGERLRFLAGQYATLHLPGELALDASIASCPCDERRLEFHLRHLAGDPVTDYVFGRLKVGDFLDLDAPKGAFVLDESSRGPLLLVAFDTGFAAIKSLLEHATAQEQERDTRLIWLACAPEGHYMDNLCRSWQDALDDFRYVPVGLGEGHTEVDSGGPELRQALEDVMRHDADLADREVYMAAPGSLLDLARPLFLRAGVMPERMHLERVRGNKDTSCLSPDAG